MNIAQASELALRAKKLHRQTLNEEQTKNALVLPFLKSLGYDIFNPNEVAAEFTSDVGTKKGERIDYAIFHKDKPALLIECKPLGDCLDKGRCSQLRRYFQNHISARIGILTDGVRYLFFSDLRNQNLMDDEPFFEIDISSPNEQFLPILRSLSKKEWSVDSVLDMGGYLRDLKTVQDLVSRELAAPSDDFIRYIASRVTTSPRITAKIVGYFKPIVKEAISGRIAAIIDARLDSAKSGAKAIQDAEEISDSGIYTTNTEIWGFLIVRTLLCEEIDPQRIAIRDQKSYCSVLLDDNNRKPICRFYNFVDWDWEDEHIGEKAYVHIFNTETGEKFPLRFVDDLYPLKKELERAAKRY